jgi:glutamate 5-kinase
MGGEAGTAGAKGGMKTKLMAAKVAMQAGCAMAIMQGAVNHPLQALENGANCTWFAAKDSPHTARKRWISGMKPVGEIHVDAGAAAALGRGNSLLPAGVARVAGDFLRGDPVRIVGPEGVELAKGLVGYSAAEAAKITGRQSAEIEEILGYAGRAALVHRDDMVI